MVLGPQKYTKDGTREEITGWRDESISLRHRRWGVDCPATDIDLILVEYNFGKPVGLIEYKHKKVETVNLREPTYKAMSDLASNYKTPLPFLVAFYDPKDWSFRVLPVNDKAREFFKENEELTEFDFVCRLYRIRNNTIKQQISDTLNNTRNESCNATAQSNHPMTRTAVNKSATHDTQATGPGTSTTRAAT